MDLSNERGRSSSHLFLLRLWAEDESNAQDMWSARLQHIFTGETHTFRACPQLVDVLLELSGSPPATRQKDVEA
jgi:hypothetical protein